MITVGGASSLKNVITRVSCSRKRGEHRFEVGVSGPKGHGGTTQHPIFDVDIDNAMAISGDLFRGVEARRGAVADVVIDPETYVVKPRDKTSQFRRTAQPETTSYSTASPHIAWQQVGDEWHAVTGPWDLYETVVRRTRSILEDPRLSDAPLVST